MAEADLIFASLVGKLIDAAPSMVCLYTGPACPSSCSPMPRLPSPQTGQPLDASFAETLAAAIALNPAVHDGAVMVGRKDASSRYRVSGWSYRLFPPDGSGGATPNRGSAFNSCLAMSEVAGVDRLYFVNNRCALRFERGAARRLGLP